MSVRETGKKNKKHPNALPVLSMDKKEDAEMLQTILCCTTNDGRQVLTKYAGKSLEMKQLNEVAAYLDTAYRKFFLKEDNGFTVY
jgi:hypothetical protein